VARFLNSLRKQKRGQEPRLVIKLSISQAVVSTCVPNASSAESGVRCSRWALSKASARLTSLSLVSVSGGSGGGASGRGGGGVVLIEELMASGIFKLQPAVKWIYDKYSKLLPVF
jgi:hypothetical protein